MEAAGTRGNVRTGPRVARQPDLQLLYRPDSQLAIAGYLTIPSFWGSLTQLRTNDELAFTQRTDRQCVMRGPRN